MKIIIIGNGKVGYTLAQQLSGDGEDHDLILIDKNPDALRNADGVLDILCMEGSGASIQVLLEAGVRSADLVVAVTGSDELNIVCCLIAKKLGAKHTVARVRSPEYYKEANLLKREIGVSMIINPEYAAAQEISRLLRVPAAFSVEAFARGLVEMIGFPLLESDGMAGIPLAEYNRRHPNGVLMCAAIRGGEVFVPNGAFVPQVGDKVYIIGSQRETARFFESLGRSGSGIRHITVLGGSKIATYLAWAVEKVGMKVRIVEQDPAKCEALADKLPGSLIIQGDGTDSAVIETENLLSTDAFIALTNRDEENLLMAMSAQRAGVTKVIAKMNRTIRTGKQHFIIMVAEGVGGVEEMAKYIEEKSGVETRATILGHVQRGGSPSARDRIIASEMGHHAVELLKEGIGNRVVIYRASKVVDMDILEALNMKREFDEKLYEIANEISI